MRIRKLIKFLLFSFSMVLLGSLNSCQIFGLSSQKVDNFLVEIQGCRRNRVTLVECKLFITNQEQEDRYLSLSSKVTDSEGKEHSISNISIAGQSVTFNYFFKPNIKVSIDLTFVILSTQVSKFQLLELSGSYGSTEKPFQVQFRDIPISN